MSLMILVLIAWVGCTVVLTCLLIYRATIGSHEEQHLSLTAVEQSSEQALLQSAQRINRVDFLIKNFAIASGVLLLLVGAVWFRRGLYGPMILF